MLLGLVVCSFNLFALQSDQEPNAQDGAIIECTGKYALCITTDCPTSTDDRSTATCNCPVYVGKNWGTNSCAERLAATQGQVYSEYSPIYLLASSGTTPMAKKAFNPSSFCSTSNNVKSKYVNCLNVLCTLEGQENAVCPCPIVTTQANDPGYFIEADNCAKASTICNQLSSIDSPVAINSAPVAFSTRIVNTSLNSYGDTVDESMFCDPIKDKEQEDVSSIIKSDKKTEIKDTLETFAKDNQEDDPNHITAERALNIKIDSDEINAIKTK